MAVGFLAGLPAGAATCPEPARQAYDQGVALWERYGTRCRETCLAEQHYFFARAVALCPENAPAHNNLADVYERQGRYPEALRHYRRAAELDPQLAVAYLSLGDVYLRLGEYAEAVAAYDRGLALDPEDRLNKRSQRDLAEHLRTNGGRRDAAAIKLALGGPPRLQLMGPAGIREERRLGIQIPFAYDSDRLLPAAQAPLRELGTALADILANPESASAGFLIEGHTDQRGSEEYNRKLSEKRAARVVETLVSTYRIPRERLTIQGYGESRPLTEGTTDADHARNRRVEVVRIDAPEVVERLPENPAAPAPEPPPQGRSGPLKVQAALFYEDKDARPRKLGPGATLRSGDGYRIYVEPTQDGYLYVLQIDASGKLFPLFPNPEYGRQANPVRAQTALWVPDRTKWFELDRTTGQETLYVVASRERRTDIEDLLRRGAQGATAAKDLTQEAEVILKTMGVKSVRLGKSVETASRDGNKAELRVDELLREGEGLAYRFSFRHE